MEQHFLLQNATYFIPKIHIKHVHIVAKSIQDQILDEVDTDGLRTLIVNDISENKKINICRRFVVLKAESHVLHMTLLKFEELNGLYYPKISCIYPERYP